MSDQPDELKADLFAILEGGPAPVTADEAMVRMRSSDTRRAMGSPRTLVGSRRRLKLVAALSFAVVVGLLVSLAISGHIGGSGTSPGHPDHPYAPVVLPYSVLPAVPASVFEDVGLPSELVNFPKEPSGTYTPIISHGLPELLYVWASYCPFCAAENWAIGLALSRFGTFSGLSTTHSSATDFAPDTPMIGFYKATYTSPYLVFQSYDLATNQPSPGDAQCNINGYTCLQTAPDSVLQLLETIGGGSFPFIDFDNKVIQSGAGFENQPLMLKGLTARQIGAQLSNPGSAVAQAEVGSANYFTSAICAMTGNQPRRVCSTSLVTQAEMKEGTLANGSSLFVYNR